MLVTRNKMRISAASAISLFLICIFTSDQVAADVVNISSYDLALLKPLAEPYVEAGLLTSEQAVLLAKGESPMNKERRQVNMAIFDQFLADATVPHVVRRWAMVSKIAGLTWDNRLLDAFQLSEAWMGEIGATDYQLQLHVRCLLISRLVNNQNVALSPYAKLAKADVYLNLLLDSEDPERYHEDTIDGLHQLSEMRAVLAGQAFKEFHASPEYVSMDAKGKEVKDMERKQEDDLRQLAVLNRVIALANLLQSEPKLLQNYESLGGSAVHILESRKASVEYTKKIVQRNIGIRAISLSKLGLRNDSIEAEVEAGTRGTFE